MQYGPEQQHFSRSDMQIVITAFGALLTSVIKSSINENGKDYNKKIVLFIRAQLKELLITNKISGPLIDFIFCSVFILRVSKVELTHY